jgi:site-specific DNA-methyltransferase (adenine-specific)
MIEIHHGDNLRLLPTLADASFQLIYIDPPFNTGRAQARPTTQAVADQANGDRTGFQGKRYRTIQLGTKRYDDWFDDYLAFLEPRLLHAHRLLSPAGSFFLHLDWREVHYAKVLCDQIFGRESFVNEIIWAYDYGARSQTKWSTKHDTILWYAKDPSSYTFNLDAVDRIPYMAPELVGPEKAERGKTPTDVWWHTIVSPTGREKTGYPTQKPLGVLRRIVAVHSNPGDRLLDFFAGSGTLGAAALELGRDCVLIDESDDAIAVMRDRFRAAERVTFAAAHEATPLPSRERAG